VSPFDEKDLRVRVAAFEWLSEQVQRHGDVLPWKTLAAGFTLDGVRVPVVGPQGIFKPRVLPRLPLSITTVLGGPYDDAFESGDVLHYRYRGTDPLHSDNVRLREAMGSQVPLIYFHGIAHARYMAAWPVYVVGDDPGRLTFTVKVDDAEHALVGPGSDQVHDRERDARRSYVTAIVRVRMHQRSFRERVLDAYRRQCAFCHFRHEEMLDAAHIVPDAHPRGEPVVRNGLALCALHHSAFDHYFLGVRPDYVIEVRSDVLRESDGPTLVHGIQSLNGRKLLLPRERSLQPDQDLLALRYSSFLKAS
jgi:putative restriction endonuclease